MYIQIQSGLKEYGSACLTMYQKSTVKVCMSGWRSKETPGWLQKLLSFRYQKPNQIPIVGTVSNPEFEPNQISATLNQSRMRTGQASILVKVIKMSKY